MQTLHRALMGIALAAVVAAGLGTAGFYGHAALAQHGQHGQNQADSGAAGLAEHFHRMLDELALTSEQREKLAEPLGQAFAAMQELHRLHGVIAAELDEEQVAKLNEMVHGMMGAGMASDDHDAEPHGGHPHGGALN